MKRADVILGVTVVMICVIWLGARFFLRKEGAVAEVRVDGELYGTYALDKEQEVDIGTGNRILIADASVQMIYADCPDQICVHQGRISSGGATITCLPHRVTVQVHGADQADDEGPDVIVN